MNRKRKPPAEDITGKRYGMLVVEEMYQDLVKKPRGSYLCRCQCDCGNKHEVMAAALKAGRTKSCGCKRDHYAKIKGVNNPGYTGYKELNGTFWNRIQKRAERRGIKYNLTIEYAYRLYTKQSGKCALTGIDIDFGNWNTNPTASLDRIDNSKGYVKGNVQWVHKDVNIMKNVFDTEYFIELCRKVVDNAN